MACGVPVAIIGVADNQRAVVEGIERRAAGVCLGWHDTLDLLAAADLVSALLRDPARLAELAGKGRATVDGRGVHRVLDALLDVIDTQPAGRDASPHAGRRPSKGGSGGRVDHPKRA
jgi:hypothetical protein